MKISATLITLAFLGLPMSSQAALIAGVDFEDGVGGFSRAPDDLDLSDGITVSSGSGSGVFDGWTLGANGNLRDDGGANSAGAYSGNFPARLQDSVGGSWSITIPDTVVLNLDQIQFAVRGATGGSGRDIQFRTSLEGATEFLYENLNLPGRNTGWTLVTLDLTDIKYDGLTNTTIDFIWISPNAADLDAITVSGTIIPEPSGIVLFGMGGLGPDHASTPPLARLTSEHIMLLPRHTAEMMDKRQGMANATRVLPTDA